jgi:hypothetical protein
MIEVRRGDGELCGYVEVTNGRWHALTLFGAVLGEHGDEAAARDHVVSEGLRALADHWTLIDPASGDGQPVCIQQVTPVAVTLALGYYSLPGVPTMTIPIDELASGRWILVRGA